MALPAVSVIDVVVAVALVPEFGVTSWTIETATYTVLVDVSH
jgi:hypothetical protein